MCWYSPRPLSSQICLYSIVHIMGRLFIPSKQQLSAPFQSKDTFVEFARAPQGKDGQTIIGDAKWSNKDLEPTPEDDRTWTW